MPSSHLSLVGGPHPDPTPSTGDHRLAAALTETAVALHTATGTSAVLDELVAAALRLVPGTQDASVLVVRHEQLTSRHPSDSAVDEVDACQLEADEGPALEAVSQAHPVRVPDLGQEQRWPTFAPRACRIGVVSVLSLPIRVERSAFGALNLWSRQVGAFDDESEQVGLLLVSHAAIALGHARSIDHLARAMASRDLIGQAKGRLMERHDLDEERAFGVLRRVSQSTHRKLHDIARELAVTGELSAPIEPGPE